MERSCSGCQWLSEEISRRQDILDEFERRSDQRLAQITRESIDSLFADWNAHRNRDHAAAAPPPGASNPDIATQMALLLAECRNSC